MQQTHSYFDRKVNLKTFTTFEGEKNLVRNHIKHGLKCCTICSDEMWFYRDNIFVKKSTPTPTVRFSHRGINPLDEIKKVKVCNM